MTTPATEGNGTDGHEDWRKAQAGTEHDVVRAWVEADLREAQYRVQARDARSAVAVAASEAEAALAALTATVTVAAGKARTFLIEIDGATHVVRITAKGPSRVPHVE